MAKSTGDRGSPLQCFLTHSAEEATLPLLSFLLSLPEGHRQCGHGQGQEDGHGDQSGGVGAEGVIDHAPAGGGCEGGHGAAGDDHGPDGGVVPSAEELADHHGHQSTQRAAAQSQTDQGRIDTDAQSQQAKAQGVQHQHRDQGLDDAEAAAQHALGHAAHRHEGRHDGEHQADLALAPAHAAQDRRKLLGNAAAHGDGAHDEGRQEEFRTAQGLLLAGSVTGGVGVADAAGQVPLAQDHQSQQGQRGPADAQHPVAEPPAQLRDEFGEPVAPDHAADAGARHDEAQDGRCIGAGVGLLDDDIGGQVHAGAAYEAHQTARHIEHPQGIGEGEDPGSRAAPQGTDQHHAPDTVLVHVGAQKRCTDGTRRHHEAVIQGEAAPSEAQIRADRGDEKAQCRGQKAHGQHQQKRRQGRTKLVLPHCCHSSIKCDKIDFIVLYRPKCINKKSIITK